ncbi:MULTISPECIES: universal stress protein [Amycolatopsis]|uniref:universal stress protein n=1 Tax=Amycolatopsis TaxID=1813 RepID=UPI0033A308D1
MTVRLQTQETRAPARDRMRPVVVGVDGSGSALDAVRWGARDAARLGVPLRLVHAYPRSDRDYPALSMNADQIRAELRAWGADRLRAAEAVAQETAPGVPVEQRLCEGDPRVVLRRESEHAASVVLGHDGSGGLSRLVFGSCGLALTVHGHRPVVVVRGRVTDQGSIVVGVDGTITAARYAMKMAALYDTSVTAVRTWHAAPGDPADRHDAEHRALVARMAPLTEEFPGVPVEYLVLRGRPGHTLLEFGQHARLLVVGTHGSSAFAGLLLGSTSQSLAFRAPCPVAVVPEDPEDV